MKVCFKRASGTFHCLGKDSIPGDEVSRLNSAEISLGPGEICKRVEKFLSVELSKAFGRDKQVISRDR